MSIYMGYALKLSERVWMSGGAGYVLSRQAYQDLIAFLRQNKLPMMRVRLIIPLQNCIH